MGFSKRPHSQKDKSGHSQNCQRDHSDTVQEDEGLSGKDGIFRGILYRIQKHLRVFHIQIVVPFFHSLVSQRIAVLSFSVEEDGQIVILHGGYRGGDCKAADPGSGIFRISHKYILAVFVGGIGDGSAVFVRDSHFQVVLSSVGKAQPVTVRGSGFG